MASLRLAERQHGLRAVGLQRGGSAGTRTINTRPAPITAHSMPRKQASSATTDGDPSDAKAKPTPHFDHSPNSLPEYALLLRKWLPDQDSQYVLLVEQHIVLDRRVACCRDKAHIQDLDKSSFRKGTFEIKPYLHPALARYYSRSFPRTTSKMPYPRPAWIHLLRRTPRPQLPTPQHSTQPPPLQLAPAHVSPIH